MSKIESPQAGQQPVVLVDVDGVLLIEAIPEGNATGTAEAWQPAPESKPQSFYNPKHGTLIKKLLILADVYYMSGHEEDSHADIGRHLELPELDWINFAVYRELLKGKQAVVRAGEIDNPERVTAEFMRRRRQAAQSIFSGRALAWIDDLHGAAEIEWARRRSMDEAPTLLVRPNMARGLEVEDLEYVYDWVGKLTVR